MNEHKVRISVEYMGWTQEEVHEVTQKRDLPWILRHMADSYEESLDALREGRLRVDSLLEEER